MTLTPHERVPGELVFHFEVDRNSIPLKQFVDTARASQAILDDFNEQLFDKKFKYELHVKTPEEGSLVEILQLIAVGGGAVWAFLCTDIGKAYFTALTDREPAYWAEKAGLKTRQIFQGVLQSEKSEGDAAPDQSPTSEEIAQLDAELVVALVVAFLEANSDKLQKVGITPAKFRKAFSGRNSVYRGCIDNPEIKAISFDRAETFQITRQEFPRYIENIPEAEIEESSTSSSWNIEAVDIIVNSPNWKRDGRKWQAAKDKFQDVSFSIEDEAFWHHVDIKDIQPDIRDNMRVQWAYPSGHSKPSSVRVLRVLTYNGKTISAPLSEQELLSQLDEVYIVEPETRGLFDEPHNFKNDNTEGEE